MQDQDPKTQLSMADGGFHALVRVLGSAIEDKDMLYDRLAWQQDGHRKALTAAS